MKDNVWRSEDEYLHDNLLDFTIIGAAHMAHRLTEFPAWAKAMLAVEGSESLRPFLRMIFVNSKPCSTACGRLVLLTTEPLQRWKSDEKVYSQSHDAVICVCNYERAVCFRCYAVRSHRPYSTSSLSTSRALKHSAQKCQEKFKRICGGQIRSNTHRLVLPPIGVNQLEVAFRAILPGST